MLLCDEPIASLDPNASKVIMDYLKNISTTMGITVVTNLHQVDVALNYSDRIVGISEGKVVYNGSPQSLSTAQIYELYGSEAGDLMLNIGDRHVI